MAKGGKKNSNYTSQSRRPDSDYDIAQSMQRVRQYRTRKGSNSTRDTTKSDVGYDNRSYLSSQSEYPNGLTSEPARDFYFRLEDQMSDYNDKNEVAHNDLRKSFETKISDISKELLDIRKSVTEKVSNNTFRWIIGGIIGAAVLIAGIWASLSYYPLVEKIESHTDIIHNLDKRINNIENSPIRK